MDRAALIALGLVAAIHPVCAQTARPVWSVHTAREAPVVDGRLDEACWRAAAALDGFTQVLPAEGSRPTERTEVRFVATDDQLYIGVRCFDGEPGKILAREMGRDSEFDSDDVVRIAFDTFGRERDGYLFAVNPAGARSDAVFGRFSGENQSWDGLWSARASIDGQGWTAELAIPFKSLSFDPRAAAWRCNIERVIRRKQETVRWTALARAKSLTALEDFGELRGLRDLRQGLGLELRPYVRATRRDGPAATTRDLETTAGVDATYRITPTLTALATYNTDFAETEVDARVVNLSRFPEFFPEKRDFFLQDAPLFRFGGLDESNSPYYSRRIGLGAGGRPVDIIAGGRLTGRAGGTSIALLDVYQDAQAGIDARNLAVVRLAQQVLAESSVGAIFTSGDPHSNGDAWLGGVDFSYQNSRLKGERVLTGNAYLMVSDADRAGGRGTAFGFDLDYPNEPLDVHAFFRQWGERFEPTLGFIDRAGVREYIVSAEYIWRPNTRWLRRAVLELRPYFTTDLDGRLVAEDHDAPVFTFETPAGDELVVEYTQYRDVLDEPFAIRPGIVIPVGSHAYGQFKGRIETSQARSLSVRASWRTGDFYTGTRTDLGAGFTWRPSRHLSASASYEHRMIRLPEGAFDVRLASGRVDVAVTPDLTWSAVVQYDNLSDTLGLNTRVRWTFRPGNDVFLVVGETWDYDDARLRHLSGDVTLKIGVTLRY